MQITCKAYPRAGLIGNPSDGYFGKTIAIPFTNFCAEVSLIDADQLVIVPGNRDKNTFRGIAELYSDISQFGYYGGRRLLLATLKNFVDFARSEGIPLHGGNFRLEYKTTIPELLGLAGSSAIIIALLKALMKYYQINLEPALLANLALSVENKELSISAGLQDRVVQVYERPIFMDFSEWIMEKQGFGNYKEIPSDLFKNFYIAYDKSNPLSSEKMHNNLRQRYLNGDKKVLIAMKKLGELTLKFKDALENGDEKLQNECINENYELRSGIIQMNERDMNLVRLAKSAGASAKMCGSGGSIIGKYQSEEHFSELKSLFIKNQVSILKPQIPNDN